MDSNESTTRYTAGRLVFGLFLLAIGGMLLAGNLGFDLPHGVWNYWPFLLLAMGGVKLLWPGNADERRSGYWLVVVGLYGWINVWHLFGLDWGRSWPIFVIASGLGIVFGGFCGRWRRRGVDSAS